MDALKRLQPGVAPLRAVDRLVSWLANRGVRRVFGIPGGAIGPLFDALVDSDLEVVVCQHEMMAVYLASGHARATGRPGVVAVTSGPGILNTVSAVAAAYQDETPLLVLAGEVRTDWAGRGAIQDGGVDGLDILSVFRSVVRFQDTLDQPERLEALLGTAEAAAMTHPRGPALLRLPVDLASAPVPGMPDWRAAIAADDPSADAIERTAALLSQARCPAILAGIGARTAGVGDLVERIAYRLRAPVMTDLEAKGMVSERDPLCFGLVGIGQSPTVDRLLEQPPDVLLTIGARMDDTCTAGFSNTLRPTEHFIQFDHDPKRIHRPWPAEPTVVADLRVALSMLLDALPPLGLPTLLERDDLLRRMRVPSAVPDPLGSAPHHPATVVAALQQAFGPDTVFTSDIGNHLLFASRHLTATHSSAFQMSLGLGSMGSGIGMAMGLAAAYRNSRPVVGICGDGGLLMVGNELATCARYQIPVVLAVFDNQGLGMIDHGMTGTFGRSHYAGVPSVDIVRYARALGADARTIGSASDLAEALAHRPPGPVVLHFPIDPTITAGNPRAHGFAVRSRP